MQRFLLDLANSQADRKRLVWKLSKGHPKMVPLPEDVERSMPSDIFEPGKAKEWLENCFANLRGYLRFAWQQPEGYPRFGAMADLEYRVWQLHRLFERKTKTEDFYSAIRAGRCWLCIYRAVHHAEVLDDKGKMALCGNPGCCTPYYFVCKKGQRFCSEKCAGVGGREAKRRWWREHGKQWRAGRKTKQQPKTKGRKRT
jgi:hypothetical protein